MAEYIEREAVLKQARFIHGKWDDRYISETNIKSIPTADLAEVVRCKDCNKRRTTECRFGITVFDAPKGNDFCSRGEKNG